MDSGTCRSGRTGSAPRDETFGYARGLEEGHRLRGEMRQPLCGKKRVRRNTERGVMVETPPASPFKMIEPQLVLQLLVVPLDAPAQHRELDQIGADKGFFAAEFIETLLERQIEPHIAVNPRSSGAQVA